jgi:hypothetical protein
VGVLKVRVNGVWEDVGVNLTEPPLDEVWIGPDPPDPVGTYEAWFNTSSTPATVNYKAASGQWTEAGSSEVEIGPTDPYVTHPGSRAEIWMDTSIGQGGKLKFRQPPGPQGAWRAVSEFTESEVEISPSPPLGQGGVTDAELWVDTSASPPVLNGYVNGAWVPLAGPSEPNRPGEVHIGPPGAFGPEIELWYDTTNSPQGVLYANNFGVWEAVAGNEVFVGVTDPYMTDATAKVDLWQDTSGGTPGILKVRINGVWHPVIRYGGISYEQQYGQQPNVGTLDVAARADHTHGTPDEEVWVGADDPVATDAQGNPGRAPGAELWYDTDAVATITTNTQQFASLNQRIAELEAAVRRLGGMS